MAVDALASRAAAAEEGLQTGERPSLSHKRAGNDAGGRAAGYAGRAGHIKQSGSSLERRKAKETIASWNLHHSNIVWQL